MRLSVKLLSLLAAVGTAALMQPVTASAAVLNCAQFSHTQIVTVTTAKTTSSTTYVPWGGAAFTQVFFNDSCVVVEFSAQVKARTPAIARIRIFAESMDPAASAFPAAINFTTAGSGFDGRSAKFVFPVLEGEYTIRVQFLSVNGSPVTLDKGTLKILFNNES